MHLQRKSKIENVLNSKHCFKLVCGAGNEDVLEVEKLVYLYSVAGCNIFDVSASVDVVKAAKRGIEKSGIFEDRFISVSVGIKGDPHVNKVKVNSDLCEKCFACLSVCPQSAMNSELVVDEKKCIGCGKCVDICKQSAISLYSKPTDLKNVLPKIISEGIDCLEFHAIGLDEDEVDEKWNYINDNFEGVLSVCIDREKLSNERLISRLKRLLAVRGNRSTIIQADGSPMSGGVDDFKTTLQAVATAEVIIKNNIKAYILLSGGTNSKTKQLADLCGIDVNGVAIGSFARKIVKDYLCDKMSFDEALVIAKNLVKSIY